MRLNSLRMVNFRQHVDTRLEFDLGLTGIIGPNGAGKSTILEAMAWALYGHQAARGTRDSIRFNRAGASAKVRVELDFEVGGHRYRVERGLTSAELYLDGSETPIATSLTAVTDLVQRRLGMTRQEFFSTYFTGQKELNFMAGTGPAERAQFFSRVLGYERIRTAQGIVRERKKEIVAELAGLRAAFPDPESSVKAVNDASLAMASATRREQEADAEFARQSKAHADILPRWHEMQRARDQDAAWNGELRVIATQLDGIGRDIDRLERERGEMSGAQTELERLAPELVPFAGYVREFEQMEETRRAEGRRLALMETRQTLVAENDSDRLQLTRLETAPTYEEEITKELEAERRALEGAKDQREGEHTTWVKSRQSVTTRREELRRQIEDLVKQRSTVTDLGEDGICPTCTRTLGAAFRSVLDQIDAQLETLRVDEEWLRKREEQLTRAPDQLGDLDRQLEQRELQIRTLERKLGKVQRAVQDLSTLSRTVAARESRLAEIEAEMHALPANYDAARHAEIRQERDRLVVLNATAERLRLRLEREPQIRDDHARAVAERERVSTLHREMTSRLAAHAFSEARYTQMRQDIEQIATASRTAEIARAEARAERQTAAANLETAKRALEEHERLAARVDVLQRDQRMHDELDRAFSDLRTDLNTELRPELAELASSFLAELTDHRYSELELDDAYNAIILEDGIPKPVVSGGEEDLCNLVLRLAISQMIAERAGQSFSLLVLDEIFGALDDLRRQSVVELLRRLGDRFEQIIVITHIDSVRDGLDRVIVVELDEESGASRVREVEASDTGVLVGALIDDASSDE